MEERWAEFGHRIRSARLKAAIPAQDLANGADLSLAYWHKMERGAMAPPSTPKILKIAEMLNLDPDSLLAVIGRMRPERWKQLWTGVLHTAGITGLSPADQQVFVERQLAKLGDSID